ncbi:MAG: hypothetical protein E7361_04425 [Clostridiales bacterium]|nr:hypothetical protein [Clostridiales bacterium]
MSNNDEIELITTNKRDLTSYDEGGKVVNRQYRDEQDQYNKNVIDDINTAKLEAVIGNVDNIDKYTANKKISKKATLCAVAGLGVIALSIFGVGEVSDPMLSRIIGAVGILGAEAYFLGGIKALDGRKKAKEAKSDIIKNSNSRILQKKYHDIGHDMSKDEIFDIVMSTADNIEEYSKSKSNMDRIVRSMDESVM